MKIVVDGYELGPHGAGVGRVVKNILPRLSNELSDAQFFVLTREVVVPFHSRFLHQLVLPSRGGYFRWQNGPFWRACWRLHPDLILAFNYTLPLYSPWPSVLFVHDVSILSHPEWFPSKTARWRGLVLRRSLRRARVVVVPSRATQDELLVHGRIEKEKIKLIYYGVEDKFEPVDGEAVLRWKKARGLGSARVIGFLGSIFRRRHLPLLVEAVAKLRKRNPDIFLYVIGQDRTYPPEDMATHFDRDWIKWDRYLPEAEIPLFYTACDVFAYLSEYEGFGLPPLEALACGSIPVVLNRSSLGEVFSDLAVLVDIPSVEAVSEALDRALNDVSTRVAIQEKFRGRRPEFSWDHASRELAALILRMAG